MLKSRTLCSARGALSSAQLKDSDCLPASNLSTEISHASSIRLIHCAKERSRVVRTIEVELRQVESGIVVGL